MNRIYQGRVTAVEVPDGKDDQGKPKWKPLENWQEKLWQHHELFQDAVNYYTLALAAMVRGVKGKDKQEKALQEWSAKVEETWQIANRKSETFAGPQKRLASILNLPANSSFGKAVTRVIRLSRATAEQRGKALIQLLSEKGDLNQICVSRLPWLATASGKFTGTSKAEASSQEVKRQREVRRFHELTMKEALKEAATLDLALFLTQPPKEFVKGALAAKMLRDYFTKVSKKFNKIKSVASAFEKFVVGETDKLRIPLLGRKPSGLYPAAALFKFFPCSETLATFRNATKTLAEAKDKERMTDAIAQARVNDQPQFDYFTNLVFVDGDADDERNKRAVWFEFDLAAFVEAIKAPRRYLDDTTTREADADRFRQQIAAMESRGREGGATDEDEESLPGFEGDSRIDLLKKIVRDSLKWIAEAEGDADEAVRREYTIRERTVRGFCEIKRRWRSAVDTKKDTEKELLEILKLEQTEHREDFGSAAFYQQLAKPEFHPIWRDNKSQPWHAEDPLAAWLKYKELQADLADKERAIRFTPAHPEHSPRFFIFPKRSESQPKNVKNRPNKPGLLSRHDLGQLSFTGGIILPTNRDLVPSVVRIHYGAPRICRDQLRTIGDNNLYEAPWLQPMMVALDLDKAPDKINFANCRIILQPTNKTDIQLTFPVEVNTDKIRATVARDNTWQNQFNLFPDGKEFCNASLRWPHEKQPKKPPVPWFEQVNLFSCVATDLGQRNAGAFARLLASSGDDFGERPSRFIGTTGNKRWQAALVRSGMFCLPGEDAHVWRAKSSIDNQNTGDSGKPFDFREELWGERGRPARDWEADETVKLMEELEVPPDEKELSLLSDNWRSALSFPEQNDKLLIAMRRYQSRISRLHRWCWFLKGDDKQQRTAWKEIVECEDTRLISAHHREQASKSDPCLLIQLETALKKRLEIAPDLLARIANRILALRGRSWKWEKNPVATNRNILHLLTQNGQSLDTMEKRTWLRGQRGLSFQRIEQIEELRKRCQSLNQTQRREIGSKPPIRRDESVPDPCPDFLEKLDNLKEQRINQTAHMILAESLGLRLASPPADKKELHQERDQHGVYEKILDKSGKWIGPADFIVIEDLSRYRASQGRAPRENSRLMKWCHRAVKDKLKQLCEVFGVPVLETPAAYSSRFCARSGVAGFRAVEITPGFTKHGYWAWLAGKKNDEGEPTADAKELLNLDDQLCNAQIDLEANWEAKHPGEPCPKRTALVPQAGGPIFIPVVETKANGELNSAVVHADINAAINLGLRAISDPRLWEIHPRLRTERISGEMKKHSDNKKSKESTDTIKATPALKARERRKYGELGPNLELDNPPKGSAVEDTRNPNYFFDVAGIASWDRAKIKDSITGKSISLSSGKALWSAVKERQRKRCKEINDAHFTKWKKRLS